MHRFAKPSTFLRWSRRLIPIAATLCALSFGLGLYYALLASPPDYQQGETVRIMYVHVPAAAVAMMAYSIMAVCSAMYLIWKHPLADVLAQSSALPGAAFTLLALASGALWGKPMWGAYWVWDARLTSFLLLFFLYLGYMAFGTSQAEGTRRSAAILALVGFINIPVIKFSVEWWSTLHQPASLLRFGKPAVDPSMLTPLLLMLAGCVLFFLLVVMIRAETGLLERKIERAQRY